jgi:malic enzyme
MKKILIVGAGACGLAINKVLSAQGLSNEDVIIVTPENVDQHKEEIMAQSQFAPEPIMIHAQPKNDEFFIPRVNEKPFWQTMKKSKWKNKKKKH